MSEKMPDTSSSDVAKGVQTLIDRLRLEGVERGQKEAEDRIRMVEEKAEAILAEANKKAEDIRRATEDEAQRTRETMVSALHVAARETVQNLKQELSRLFDNQVQKKVTASLADMDFLKSLILSIAGNAVESEKVRKGATVLLPSTPTDMEHLRRNPEKIEKGTLASLVAGLSEDMLAEGVELKSGRHHHGLRVCLKDSILEVDLTDESITSVLLENLRPRYRALLEGIIRQEI